MGHPSNTTDVPGPDDETSHIRPRPGPRPDATYAAPVAAVILAGTHENPRHRIAGCNKAFLPFHGKPMVRRVVEGLLAATALDRIFVVGPVDDLAAALEGLPGRVRAVPQAGSLMRNAWAGYQAAERIRVGDATLPLLFVSCDLPLLVPEAVDDFVARCAAADQGGSGPHALLVGVAEEVALAPFYPRAGRPGIRRPYVELRSGRYRLANIYLARPPLLDHLDVLQAGFEHRKAKYVGNVLGLAWEFLRRGGAGAARIVLVLQAARMAARRGGRLYRALRRRVTLERLESACGRLLGGRVAMVSTPFGGLSLDVDDEADLEVIGARFADWAGSQSAAGARPA